MKYYLVLTLLLLTGYLSAQTNKEQALAKARDAIKLMDGGQIAESKKLLEESIRLDPENINYPYEMAYAHYITQDYKEAIRILTPLTKSKDVYDRVYQLLGNSYDYIGQREKAIEVYQEGIKKLPKSGKLYLELGGMYSTSKEYDKAISYYENGIDVEPGFPSNYYRLALLFLNSEEKVWGMIYGEIFMNLERNTSRTAEISKLLYDTYKSEIKYTSDTSVTVSFSRKALVVEVSKKKPKLPFAFGAYESTLMMSALSEKQIDINSLDRIRSRFVENYYLNHRDLEYPTVLFDYQYKLLKEGHLEAYNHWILMKGDEDGFTKWQDSNADKWEQFVNWFNPNGLIIDDKHKFIRTQY